MIAALPEMDARIDLDAAYTAARTVARDHAKTFYLSSLFLPHEKRRAIWAVYAFCRGADDIVDHGGAPERRLAALDAWESQLTAAYGGVPRDPIFVAFADAVRRFAIPSEPARDLLRGARMDITVTRYATYEDLREYCYLVASTVGLLTSPVLGYRDGALGYGIELGRAMQLTNILRDVGEDARMGRIYLPQEDLRRFGYDEERLFAGIVDDAFVALMRYQIERVRALYAQAEPGIDYLSAESRYTVRLALTLYRGILAAIERNGYDVFTRRAFIPMRSKLATAASVALRR